MRELTKLVKAFRLVPCRFADRAFLGEGARKVDGRRNPRKVRAVYASGTLSPASLGLIAHLSGPHEAPELVSFRLTFGFKRSDCPKHGNGCRVPWKRPG